MYLHKLKFEFQRKGTRKSGRKSKSFQGPNVAMDPSQYLLTSLSQLCQRTEQQSFENVSRPPKQILERRVFHTLNISMMSRVLVGIFTTNIGLVIIQKGGSSPLIGTSNSNSRDSKQQQYVEVSNRLLAQD